MKLKFFTILISIFFLMSCTANASTLPIITLINQYRVEHGLPALKENKALKVTAIYKAKQMDKSRLNFSHKDFEKLMKLNFKNYPYIVAGEILGYGAYFDKELLEAWKKSPTHDAILLDNDFKEIGCVRTKISSVCHLGSL